MAYFISSKVLNFLIALRVGFGGISIFSEQNLFVNGDSYGVLMSWDQPFCVLGFVLIFDVAQ